MRKAVFLQPEFRYISAPVKHFSVCWNVKHYPNQLLSLYVATQQASAVFHFALKALRVLYQISGLFDTHICGYFNLIDCVDHTIFRCKLHRYYAVISVISYPVTYKLK